MIAENRRKAGAVGEGSLGEEKQKAQEGCEV